MLASDFITDALTDIGVTSAGETPTSDEMNYGLRLVNQTLDSWSAEALPIYQITREVIPMNGALSYPLLVRPVKIKSAAIEAASLVIRLKIVTAEEWAAGAGSPSQPAFWHDGGFPVGSIWMRPTPTSGLLELYSYHPFTAFLGLSSDIAFPPGYQLALRRALGVELSDGFGRPAGDRLVQLAGAAKTAIAGLNAAVLGPPTGGAAAA